jgi:parallel beta-helix repeat protein
MRRTLLSLSTMALTLLVASGLALAMGVGSAAAQSSGVGPDESIQKAIYAADPGDTIVVKGVHREDVVIRKNGIKLRGDDAVIEAPTRAKADSPCSAICVLGEVNLETGELTGPRVSDVSVSGFTIRGFKDKAAFLIDVLGARNTSVVGNRITGNVANGMAFGRSVNTTIAKNHVIGGPETAEKGILVSGFNSRTKIVNNVVRSYNFGVDVNSSTNTTIVGNHLSGHSFAAILINDSPGTKIVSNDMSRSGVVGTVILGQKAANAKLVGNNISGGPFGIYVTDAHGGSFAGNTIHDNCAGMFFEAFKGEPVGGFKVTGNTLADNTRSCGGQKFDRNFSGIGIALLGASGMEVTANRISGNVPSGPTAVSGGVVVSMNPFYGDTTKPKNNSVTGNHFGRNKPDIYWDGSGSGNRFVGNLCNKSVPSSLCN